ncbi:MAG: EAL domain-containing protein [Lachnospiraceae bacterium]|nr:EAL domain-containing protein [Lachnospiraceae bacterium]
MGIFTKEQNWKRKEYETWDEAFRGLSPIIRQQSVRVASYTQVLFVQACKLKFGMNTKDGEARMRGQYSDLAYKCGMYHQLGKALVPPEYQILQQDFTGEERAVYRKYTTDGRLLVATLQERTAKATKKRKGELAEIPTTNIPWLMIRESCEQHMERWDGSGYPEGRLGSDISPIAQIVGIAKELDRIAAETKSEAPFELAYEELILDSGTKWSPELIDVLKAAKEECLNVYTKYISYTRTLPQTIGLVDKRQGRVMGLKYRAMSSDTQGTIQMYEATPWFAGIVGQPSETESAEELQELFRKTNITEDLAWYFLYEATDAILRINNCNLQIDAILLNMLPDFYQLDTQLQKINQLFVDQPVEKSQLMLTVPENFLLTAGKAKVELLQRYIRNGIRFVLDDYHPDSIPSERLIETGITTVRIAPELYLQQDTANAITKLINQGFTVLGSRADTHDTLSWLLACGAKCASGTVTGIEVSEDDMILDSLAREQV